MMQMGNKEIAVDYRRAANKQKQIKILAELNQCAERKIAEILAAEGEELPKKWQEQLQKPARRSWKFPEEPEAPETEPAEAPEATGAAPMTAEAVPAAAPEETATVTLDPSAWDRAVERKIEPGEIPAETLLRAAERQRPGEHGVPVAPRNEDEARHWVDGVGPVYASDRSRYTVRVSISTEKLLREACRLMAAAMYLEPPAFHRYSAGVLDLVHALIAEV